MTFPTTTDPIMRQPAAEASIVTASAPSWRRGLLPLLLLASMAAAPAFAGQTVPAGSTATTVQQSAQATTQSQPRLTFPPANDCVFLGGDAGKQCEARRAGAENEYARVRSGEIKMSPGVPSSSGGSFTPLSGGGSLGGFGSSSTIAPSGEPSMPSSGRSFSPNSIGNPWAGTPYGNGTGIMPR